MAKGAAMLRQVLKTGDTATLVPKITATKPVPGPGGLLVMPLPIVIVFQGSALFQVEGHTACVPDDIEKLVITPVSYSTETTTIFGSGTVVLRLTPGHRSKHARTKHGTLVVLDGGPLDLIFTPTVHASNPDGSFDPSTEFKGQALLNYVSMRPVQAVSEGE